MSSASFKIVLRTDKKRSDGLCPINIRVIKFRKVSYISSGVNIDPKFWDKPNAKVRKGHPNMARLNHFLQTLLNKYQEESLKFETNSQTLNVRRIKDVVTGRNTPSFFDFADEILARYRVKGNIGTFDKSTSIIKKLRKYAKTNILSFQDIDTRFLAQYEVHLASYHKNSVNTIAKDLKFIKTIFKYAIKEKLIGDEISPFKAYKINLVPTAKIFLNQEEIRLIKAFSGTDLMNQCRDIVLFQYYSGGIRISDALLLKVGSVINGTMTFNIRKTGSQLSHKLTPQGLEIFSRYSIGKTHDERVFDFISKDVLDDDSIEIDRSISRATSLINKTIKVVAKKAGINKSISTHSLRHSFAINAIQKGIPIEAVQKILGHSNIRETMIYAKVQNNTINDFLDNFS